MRVKFWGTRGSRPRIIKPNDIDFVYEGGNYHPERDFGGETTCVEITNDAGSIIIDAGSGIVNVPMKKSLEYHILLSHFHWDHICGLNFFVPMFMEKANINFYHVHDDAKTSIETLFNGINFPVPFQALPSNIKFHKLSKYETTELNSFNVTPFQLDHPGGAYGYRIEHDGKSISTVFDTEFTRTSKIKLGKDAEFYENLDLMIFDGMYDINEVVKERLSWGHASAHFGVDISFTRLIPRVIITHHDPALTHRQLFDRYEKIQKYYSEQVRIKTSNNEQAPNIDLIFARDGFELDV